MNTTYVARESDTKAIRFAKLEPRKINYRKRKRLLDIVGASVLLLVLLPLMLVVALAVVLTSRGPVFYVSRRVGRMGREFSFYKFRSMVLDSEAIRQDLKGKNEKEGPIFKIRRDPRVTPIGRFLRKSSIDELPQLLNVLRGDMSLVGPRPPLPSEVALYDDFAMQRLTVRPGMTCYWQIGGRSDLTFDQWMHLDHRYLQEMSFWTDLKILLKTPFAVFRGRGAY